MYTCVRARARPCAYVCVRVCGCTGAAALGAQVSARAAALGAAVSAQLVGSVNALALTDLQIIVFGNATGNHSEGRVLMLARVRKVTRDEEAVS
jgi:hypothetical protein